MTEKYKRKPNTKCFICSKLIYRRPSEISNNRGHVFCSMSCFGISCRKEIPCVICGKLILSGLNRKTCSRKCSNVHRKGIKYKINRPKDIIKYQKGLKLKLITLKGKKCERCGYDKFEILQIHHKDRNRKNNNIDNLELICPNCHYEEHYLKKSWLKSHLEKKSKIDILI
ncbi:MAG: hypothetical protein CEO12_501 [Parcubacteria group bacterium Gr01-1014_46]|nr:MAG: hypothetical protein CEO12_501 [Parcubacteria group bacterium Gr01-1014_46]